MSREFIFHDFDADMAMMRRKFDFPHVGESVRACMSVSSNPLAHSLALIFPSFDVHTHQTDIVF